MIFVRRRCVGFSWLLGLVAGAFGSQRSAGLLWTVTRRTAVGLPGVSFATSAGSAYADASVGANTGHVRCGQTSLEIDYPARGAGAQGTVYKA
eukprot:5071676-Amphidinium_carterae.1